MSEEFAEAVKQLVADKGISEALVLKTIEMALLAAYKKKFGTASNAETIIDEEKHIVKIYSRKAIVDKVKDSVFEISLEEAKKLHPGAEIGDELLIEVKPEEFGRIAAQTARQVVRQRLREIEKDIVYNEFKQREGELIVGYFQREVGGSIYVNLGRTEGLLPLSQQSPREHYKRGDRIRALLLEVKKDTKGPQIILSRTHPAFVKKIFELEVPEIADGIVVIKNIVRDPGYRTKVSVYSPRDEIDPVGACVGLKGVRIQAIIGELEGEKVDIVKWDPDIKNYIRNAMHPVKITRILIPENEKDKAIMVVPESQLAMAIGRQGQNVRLISKLVGMKIDVMTEEEFEKSEYAEYARKVAEELFKGDEEEQEVYTIDDIPGLEAEVIETLKKAGLERIEDLIDTSAEELVELTGLDREKADKLLDTLSEMVEVVEEEEEVTTEKIEKQVSEEEMIEYYECPNCGEKITEDMDKCPSCGIELEFKEK